MNLLKKTHLLILIIGLLFVFSCNTEQSDFDASLRNKSAEEFRSFIAKHPDSPLIEEATYHWARCVDKVSAYLVFLHHYPKGMYAQKTIAKIDSMGMVYVEAAPFLMGCDTCQSDEAPAHTIMLRDYYIDRTEVTVAQFAKFIEATGYLTDAEQEGSSNIYVNEKWFLKKGINWRHDVAGKKRTEEEMDHPVVHVSWFDAQAYAEWSGKRLPTEAEWEFAARGGKLSKGYLYSGSNNVDEVGWYEDNANNITHAVATKKANELGLFDMSGNVYEWCNDFFAKPYYESSPERNPTGAQTGDIVSLRGGGWNYDPDGLRNTNRINAYPLHWYGGIGFRCVADIPIEITYASLLND